MSTISIYMKFPGVDGDVSAKGFEKHIQLKSFDFSVDRKLNTQPGRTSEREGAKPVISEITLTKPVDKTTPLLFGKATKASSTDNVVIDFVKTGTNLEKYLSYTLSNVIVSKNAINYIEVKNDKGEVVESYPQETVKLNFTAVEVNYVPSGPDGKPESQVSDKYDIATAA